VLWGPVLTVWLLECFECSTTGSGEVVRRAPGLWLKLEMARSTRRPFVGSFQIASASVSFGSGRAMTWEQNEKALGQWHRKVVTTMEVGRENSEEEM
jgi:hypothetical protein